MNTKIHNSHILFFFTILCFTTWKMMSTSLDQFLIDFDQAMNISSEGYSKKYGSGQNKATIEMLKDVYNKNHFSKLTRSNTPKIPKIIHQIWVGPRPIPEVLKQLSQSWKQMHPDWEYILWTNETAEPLVINMRKDHQDVYWNAIEYGDIRARANILRYYLLYWYGGVYVDADFRCLHSLNELNYYYDFYVGISSHNVYETCNNALIASAPQHPIMKYIIDHAQYNSHQKPIFSIGVFYFSKALLEVINSTPGINIALPTNIFYSLPYKFQKQNKEIEEYIRPESMAIHYWASDSNAKYEEKNTW